MMKYNTATLYNGWECHYGHINRQRFYHMLFTAMHGDYHVSHKGNSRTVLINGCLNISLRRLYKAMHESVKLGLTSIYITDDCHMFFHNIKTIEWGY